MKNTYFNMSKVVFLALFLMNYISVAQVGIGTTNPDASSMLDIQSDAKGVLIPRMTTAQRVLVEDPGTGEPANGLMVFDTDTQSFWFYDASAWRELGIGASIHDTDGDTKIEVEKTGDDDKIRFSTRDAEDTGLTSVERMTIDNQGNTRIGDGANNTYIEADGSLSYEGTATRWDDLKVPVNSIRIRGTTDDPTWDAFIGNTALLWFRSDRSEDVLFTLQMPHAWKEGTAIFPHVHWTTGKSGDSAPGNDRVTWGLEYYWANVGDQFPTNTATITGTTVAAPNTGSILLREHVITPLGSGGISGTGSHNLSSMIVCRLYRENVSNDYPGDAGLLEIDFHYQIDSDGSRQEYTK